jgi:hypothetical protein
MFLVLFAKNNLKTILWTTCITPTRHPSIHSIHFSSFHKLQESFLQKHWSGIQQANAAVTVWDTGTHLDLLRYIGEKSAAYPREFVSVFMFIRCQA